MAGAERDQCCWLVLYEIRKHWRQTEREIKYETLFLSLLHLGCGEQRVRKMVINPDSYLRDVPGSIFGPEVVCYLVGIFFPKLLQAVAEVVPQNRPRPLPSTAFSFHYSQSSFSILYNLIS
jgi:hypothetical protein